MSNIIERAEALNVANRYANREEKAALVPELVAELKAARAENEALRSDAEMWRGVQQMYRRMTQ